MKKNFRIVLLSIFVAVFTIVFYSCIEGVAGEPIDPLNKNKKEKISDEIVLHMSKTAVKLWENRVLSTFSRNTGKNIKSVYDKDLIKYHEEENVIEIPIVFTWTAKKSWLNSTWLNCRILGTLYIELNHVSNGKTKVSFIGKEEENVSILVSESLSGNSWDEWKSGISEYMYI